MKKRQIVKWLMLIAVALVATMASADVAPIPSVKVHYAISKDVCIFGGIAVIALIVVSFVLLLAVKRKLNVVGLMTIVFLALVLIVFWLLGGYVLVHDSFREEKIEYHRVYHPATDIKLKWKRQSEEREFITSGDN